MKLSRFLTVFAVSAALVLPGCNKNKDGRLDFYKVTWYNWDGEVLEIDDRVLENTTPHYDGETPTRPDDSQYSYTFDKWTPDIAPVHGDQEYTATYSSELLVYTIDFELNGGTSASYEGSKQVASFNEAKELFFFDCVKPGWNFRGWSFKGVKIYDEKGILLANPEMERNMTFTAIFSQTVKLTIFSNNTAGGTYIGDGEYPYNTDVSVVATENEGYAFVGWYSNNELVSTSKEYNFRMWSDDFTLEARFEPKAYKLEIESNNASNGLVLLQDGVLDHYVEDYETYYQYTKQATIVALSSNEIRFLGWFNEETGELVDTNAVYSFVMPMNDYHLIAKWNYFTIAYKLNNGTNDSRNPTEYTLESETLTLYEPTRSGYTFLGWNYKDEYVTEIDPEWMDNVELTAVWSADKFNLTVTALGTEYGSVEKLSGTGYADEVIKVRATYDSSVNLFLGWFINNVKVSTSATYTFTMPSEDITIYAEFQSKAYIGMTMSNDTSDSSIYYYGLYPQTKITNSSRIEALNFVKENSEMESCGYYIYRQSFFYLKDDSEWYMCSRIPWKKIYTSGSKYLFLANVLLDSCIYHLAGSGSPYNSYEKSRMRSYMNETFFNKAFVFGSNRILVTSVDNSASTTASNSNPNACNSTSDKLFALSYKEYLNSAYGFTTTTSSTDTRKCRATDYAQSLSSVGYYDSSTKYGRYLTRSPDSNVNYVCSVDTYGAVNTSASIDQAGYFIRPAMYVSLS